MENKKFGVMVASIMITIIVSIWAIMITIIANDLKDKTIRQTQEIFELKKEIMELKKYK